MFRRNPFTRIQVIERSLLERNTPHSLPNRIEAASREVHLSPEPPKLTAEDVAELTGQGEETLPVKLTLKDVEPSSGDFAIWNTDSGAKHIVRVRANDHGRVYFKHNGVDRGDYSANLTVIGTLVTEQPKPADQERSEPAAGSGIENTHTPQIHISVRRGSVVVTDQLEERGEETFYVGSVVAENLDYALRVVKSKLGMSTDIVPRAVLLNFNKEWPTKPGIYAVKDNGVERGFRIASVTQKDVESKPLICYGRYAFVCPPPLEPQ